MEKAAAAGARAGSGWEVPLVRGAAAILAACTLSPGGWAQDLAQKSAELMAAEARTPPSVRLQVDASTLPRLDPQDTGFQAPRLDVSLFPDRRSGLGAMVGMTGVASRPGLQPVAAGAARPGLDLGVRWTHALNRARIDITAWRRMNSEDDAYTLIQQQQPLYGARVEMNLGGGRNPFALERGFVGLQLESGAKISVKRRFGGPMFYYRTAF